MKNIRKIKEAIKFLVDNDLKVADTLNGEIWFFDERYVVSDSGEGEEFCHEHKTFNAAFKEFRKLVG